jgi:hypothetical protein
MGNLPTLQRMTVYRGAGSFATIPMRVLADALSETFNRIHLLELSGFKLSSRLEVDQLARGLQARVESVQPVILWDIVLDVENETGFLDPILML